MSYFSDMSAVFGGTATSNQQQGAVGGSLGLAGMGLSAYGAISGMNAAKTAAGYSVQEANLSRSSALLDIQMNQQRQQQMVLDANRKITQNNRNTQMARAQAQTAAASSGAQFGSAAAGAQAQAADTGAYGFEGINQDLQIGNTIFGLTGQQDQLKLQMATLQSQAAQANANAATGQAWMQLGQQVVGTAAKFAAMGA